MDAPITMKSHTFQRYNDRELRPGDEFDVESERDALDLEATNFATRVKQRNQVSGGYLRSDMEAQHRKQPKLKRDK